jgi:hypothetical protein
MIKLSPRQWSHPRSSQTHSQRIRLQIILYKHLKSWNMRSKQKRSLKKWTLVIMPWITTSRVWALMQAWKTWSKDFNKNVMTYLFQSMPSGTPFLRSSQQIGRAQSVRRKSIARSTTLKKTSTALNMDLLEANLRGKDSLGVSRRLGFRTHQLRPWSTSLK